MTGCLVDTNIPSELTREKPDGRVLAFLRNWDKGRVFLCVMTIGEIYKGIAAFPTSQRRTSLQDWLDVDVRSWFAGRVLPVAEAIAERWERLAKIAKEEGLTLAVVDCVIAATALHHGLALVTRNVKDFAGLGVKISNPRET